MNVYVISPHLDDAILSLGQSIAAMRSDTVTVVTVMAGVIGPGHVTDYDKSCGFETSLEAMETRRGEDRSATYKLGAYVQHLEWLDFQYRPERETVEYLNLVDRLIELWEDGEVYAPLGIGHPDHDFVARAARAALPQTRILHVYEELPYRVLWPEQVVDRMAEIRGRYRFVDQTVVPLAAGKLDRKRHAIASYESQFPDGAEDPCLLVPERVWRIMRCD